MKSPLVSICLTCYNHQDFVKEAIESIWEQDYKNIEIIALDDGSKDNSPKVLTELAQKSPMPMEVILQENTGRIGLNVNRGIAKTRGEFIMFSSCDDKFAPNAISALVSKTIGNENLDLVISTKYFIFGQVPTSKREHSFPKGKSLNQLLEIELNGQGVFFTQGALIRKSSIDAIHGFDEGEFGDDMDFRIRLLDYFIKNNKEFICFDEFETFYYRQHSTNISKNYERHFKILYYSVKKYNKKHFPFATFKYYLRNNKSFKGMYRFIFLDPSNIRHYPKILSLLVECKFQIITKFKIWTRFTRLKKALNKYYKENRSFPVCEPWAGVSYIHAQSREDWIPNLAPKYIKKLPKGDYIYKSDGKGYKIILHTDVKIDRYKCKSGTREGHNVLAISNKEGNKF
jgi:glycosyltransferase involved in cell wall biosynthesis